MPVWHGRTPLIGAANTRQSPSYCTVSCVSMGGVVAHPSGTGNFPSPTVVIARTSCKRSDCSVVTGLLRANVKNVMPGLRRSCASSPGDELHLCDRVGAF